MLAIAFQENKLGFVLLCLTNESYPSFCEKELWTFYQRLPRESVENNYLAFVVQWIEINSEVFFCLSQFDCTELQAYRTVVSSNACYYLGN